MDLISNQIKVALFCGGRGSATIIQELLRWPTIQLTLIVNAYDDGLSTGALRESIVNMLGPSDFRKNLSYLLDPYSEGQYALKSLLELRFPQSINENDIAQIKACIHTEKLATLTEPLCTLFAQVGHELSIRITFFLQAFFNYAEAIDLPFDYRDCSLGNLIFAGAYLEKNNNFNAAAKEMSQLVSSRAKLVNVSQGENRILVGLKEDGELLASEAQIVGPQSRVPIRRIFLVDKPIVFSEWQQLNGKSIDEKESWLTTKEILPQASPEAEKALSEADIILFGPGTQHSSLLPSYRIAQQSLQRAAASVKVLVMNLEPDHDIQALACHDIVNVALSYMGDPSNLNKVITHVFLNKTGSIDKTTLLERKTYKKCAIIQDEFANKFKANIHNGSAVIETMLALWEKAVSSRRKRATLSVFIDIHKRSFALADFYEELLEIDWKHELTQVNLMVNQTPIDALTPTSFVKIQTGQYGGNFPEIGYFYDWLCNEKTDYLILLTGDGKYCFRDVMLAIKLLQQSHFGAVFGSRNQSRLQFQMSLRAAYGEKKILRTFSFLGSFLISTIFALRFGILFSDPLTGFRLFQRSKLTQLAHDIDMKNITTSISLATYLIKNTIEIAELPVNYRTFSGFADPNWRLNRGIKSLFSLFTRHT
ncbi:MAG: hypothetical protein A3F46_00110 [Legionellales bacterium RIFCSPHIGHO2_12_FULL_42_9]|nr:MAG: hypothetical protein A3F46_00110 [Legionellales bacterium RIFCSPHIGHO2_12_FULL_42_9]